MFMRSPAMMIPFDYRRFAKEGFKSLGLHDAIFSSYRFMYMEC